MYDIKAFLFDDDRGVSPVIGVTLMVAITVILAAVIASFVLGLGDTNESAPNVNFEYDYNGSSASPPAVEVTMTGGESFNADRVSVTGEELVASGDTAFVGEGETITSDGSIDDGQTVSAGDSFTVELDESGNPNQYELRIIFESEDGGTSSEIGGTTGPDA